MKNKLTRHLLALLPCVMSLTVPVFVPSVQAAVKSKQYQKKVILIPETGNSIVHHFFYQFMKDIGRFQYEKVEAQGSSPSEILREVLNKTGGALSEAEQKRIFDQMTQTEKKFATEFKTAGLSSESDKALKTGGSGFRGNSLADLSGLTYVLIPDFVIGKPQKLTPFKSEPVKNSDLTTTSFSASIPVVAQLHVYKLDEQKLVRSMTFKQDVPFSFAKTYDREEAPQYLNYMKNIYAQLQAGSVSFLYLNDQESKDLVQVKSPTLIGEDAKKVLISGRSERATEQWKKVLNELKIDKDFTPESHISDFLPTDLSIGVSVSVLKGYDFDDPNIVRVLLADARSNNPLNKLTSDETQLLNKARVKIDFQGASSAAGRFIDAMTEAQLLNIGMFRWMEKEIRSVPGFKITTQVSNASGDKVSLEAGMELGLDRDTWFKSEAPGENGAPPQATGFYKTRKVAYKATSAQRISMFGEAEPGDALTEIPTIPYNVTTGAYMPFRFGNESVKSGFGAYLQGAYDLTPFLDRVSGRKSSGWMSDFLSEIYTTQTVSFDATNIDFSTVQVGLMKKHYISSFAPYYGLMLGGSGRRIGDEFKVTHYNFAVDAGLSWMCWFDPFIFVNLGVNAGVNLGSQAIFPTFFDVSPRLNVGLEF
jgi:hypothetical protein